MHHTQGPTRTQVQHPRFDTHRARGQVVQRHIANRRRPRASADHRARVVDRVGPAVPKTDIPFALKDQRASSQVLHPTVGIALIVKHPVCPAVSHYPAVLHHTVHPLVIATAPYRHTPLAQDQLASRRQSAPSPVEGTGHRNIARPTQVRPVERQIGQRIVHTEVHRAVIGRQRSEPHRRRIVDRQRDAADGKRLLVDQSPGAHGVSSSIQGKRTPGRLHHAQGPTRTQVQHPRFDTHRPRGQVVQRHIANRRRPRASADHRARVVDRVGPAIPMTDIPFTLEHQRATGQVFHPPVGVILIVEHPVRTAVRQRPPVLHHTVHPLVIATAPYRHTPLAQDQLASRRQSAPSPVEGTGHRKGTIAGQIAALEKISAPRQDGGCLLRRQGAPGLPEGDSGATTADGQIDWPRRAGGKGHSICARQRDDHAVGSGGNPRGHPIRCGIPVAARGLVPCHDIARIHRHSDGYRPAGLESIGDAVSEGVGSAERGIRGVSEGAVAVGYHGPVGRLGKVEQGDRIVLRIGIVGPHVSGRGGETLAGHRIIGHAARRTIGTRNHGHCLADGIEFLDARAAEAGLGELVELSAEELTDELGNSHFCLEPLAAEIRI